MRWLRERLRAIVILTIVAVLTIVLVTYVQSAHQAIEAIQKDRAARIAAADKKTIDDCAKKHDAYVATTRILDLINQLLHQGDLDDPRIPADLRALALENQAKSDQAVSDVRAVAARADCTTPSLP